MAQVIGGNKVKLDNGQVVDAQQGGWYDGQQFWGGSLSAPGQIHSSSNQQGAGQMVSEEVNRQSAAAQGVSYENFSNYLQQQQQKAGVTPQQLGNAARTSTPGAGAGFSAPATINLPELYDQMYKSSGISELEADLSQKEKEYIDATGTINDNPFLSEATRVGRVAKLDELFQKRTANIRNDIATKKADIETRLNLETKQFDINSQAARDALNQFNTLLSMGALDGASGEDIANITRATGISSSMIQSAIQTNKNKNVSLETYDDGTNIYAIALDPMGNVVNRQVIGSSKPTGGGKASTTDYADMLKEDARSGLTLSQIFSIYSGYLDPDSIYQLYNASSKYGPDKGNISNLAKYGVTQPKSSSSDEDLF